jgi:hypothetical protein
MTHAHATAPGDRTGSTHRAVRWMFLNRRTGGITVAQWPNISLSVFIVVSLLLRIVRPHGWRATLLHVLADVAIILWGVDEVVRGVNPFRRILGSVVLLATVAHLVVH